MSLMDSYVDRDVVRHFASLIEDAATTPINIVVFGDDLWKVINDYNIEAQLPDTVSLERGLEAERKLAEKHFIDKIIAFSLSDKAIVTIKEKYLTMAGTQSSLKDELERGADIRVVDNILGAMEVAHKKRRNNILFPITGYEDEALVTAAGLAKSKTVGFRNFFVLNGHYRLSGIINVLATTENNINGFILSLRVGLNTGTSAFSKIPLVNKKSVIITGYAPMEIMQSIWMVVSQQVSGSFAALFQHTKDISDEIINRSQWMLEEVFEPCPLNLPKIGILPNSGFKIKEKYKAFDVEK